MIMFWVLVIGAWLAILIATAWVWDKYKKRPRVKVAAVIAAIGLVAAVWFGSQWWLHSTASGVRMQITWQAQINIGLDRTAQVFSATGDLVYEFTGRFDVVHDGTRFMFDVVDDDGSIRRNIIYAPAGIVVIVEH